jgi:hypothetical protein
MHILPKRQFSFTGLHGVISQKIELFMATAVIISNPTDLSAFQNKFLRKMFRSKTETVTGQNVYRLRSLIICWSSLDRIFLVIKSTRMGWAAYVASKGTMRNVIP